ncbi:hypothetical protein [Tateyamaria sp. ANG-S1]|uniref:hypothetical protein n=1 Tax=Tateyamaria sp. ANG-S1 TaxID=1577905 RepID=UPI00057DD86E|nr:hypothetical protein [Tateyamaria sp. ANG-S1]KIC48708.1 hypothetical protein RA29_13485 [Tateyamaria sp. ANG-S1]
MFRPKRNLKSHPEKRWQQRDRVFFGFGACHILAGVFLEEMSVEGFYGEWIEPGDGFRGTHVYATNGVLAFDFHGYSYRDNLLSRYWKWHQEQFYGWTATVIAVDFCLLDTSELNKRQHRGPDQYFGDPIPRARKFINSHRMPCERI